MDWVVLASDTTVKVIEEELRSRFAAIAEEKHEHDRNLSGALVTVTTDFTSTP